MIRAAVATATPRTDEPTSSTSARTDLEVEWTKAVADRKRAADRTRRPVEHGEDAVSRRVDDSSSRVLHAQSHELVMPLHEIGPGSIADRSRVRHQPGCAAAHR